MPAAATARARYQKLALRRENVLRRARYFSSLTIPSLIPPEGHHETQDLPQPYQGLGSRAVVHLSAKMMTALMPIGTPFFRLRVPKEVLVASGSLSVPKDMEANLAIYEQLAMEEVERANWRAPTNMTLQLLLVSGNACEFQDPGGRIHVFKLDQYVVQRDVLGNLVELIIKQSVDPDTLPPQTQGLLVAPPAHAASGRVNTVDLYTSVRLRGDGRWEIWQELNDNVVPNSKQISDRNPFNVLRYTSIPGESYGRSKVEEHIGDLQALEGLTKAMLDLSAMNARNLVLIRPNATGLGLKKFVETGENGAVNVGNADDVQLVRFDNIRGSQEIAVEIQRLVEALSAAFLLNSGLRRDAERVTKFELQLVAEELEGTLGGVYSQLSEDMMRSRLSHLLANMENAGRLPQISDVVEPQIIVGLEALGRQKDAARVQTLLQSLAGLPEETFDYVIWPDLLKTLFIGLDLPAAVRSDDEVAEIRQQRALAQSLATGIDPRQVQEAVQEVAQ